MTYHYEDFYKGRLLADRGHVRSDTDPNVCVCGKPYHAHRHERDEDIQELAVTEPLTLERVREYRSWAATAFNPETLRGALPSYKSLAAKVILLADYIEAREDQA